jgi:predicted RNA methylase
MTTTPQISLPSQEWFDSHYHWAANIVGTWIQDEIDIESATLIDFGCGDGTTGLGVADNFSPKMVIGVDIRDSFKNISHTAQKMAPTGRLPSNISFVQIDPSERLADKVKANVVFSWSCFEHIERRHLATIFMDI